MATLPDRTRFNAAQIIESIWEHLQLPPEALVSVRLEGQGFGLPSSFKIAEIAHSSIALSALAAAYFHSLRNNSKVPEVRVALDHALIEFKSVAMYTLDGRPPKAESHAVGGYHRTADNEWVLIHDTFAHHIRAALKTLGLPWEATPEEVSQKVLQWKAVDLEAMGMKNAAVIAALRTYEQWDATPQGKFMDEYPIVIKKIAEGPPTFLKRLGGGHNKALRNLRVLDMTHVIAGPVAGRTLAAHGADVLWVTSPTGEMIPAVDRDCARGKRTAQLDLDREDDRQTLKSLLRDAHVWIEGYRPGSLASKGFSPAQVAANSGDGIICASISAWGSRGPWRQERGFDSIIQTTSGVFRSEADHYGKGEVSRYLPTQVLDYAGGFFLATGIIAALCRQAVEGGSYTVEVSLAGTMSFVRSLGQHEDKSCFAYPDPRWQGELSNNDLLETRQTGFGLMRAVKHAASVEGLEVGWEIMPKPLGSDRAEWLHPVRGLSDSRPHL